MSLTKNKSIWTVQDTGAEYNTGEVKTVPSQAQSIREILFRNTNGMAYDNYKTPFYEDQASFSSQSFNKIQDMDITDKMAFLQHVQNTAKDLETKISDYQKEKQALLEAEANKSKQLEEFEKSQEGLEPK